MARNTIFTTLVNGVSADCEPQTTAAIAPPASQAPCDDSEPTCGCCGGMLALLMGAQTALAAG
jgi:hypothetical protein